jgi:hypothetical protein
MLGDPDGVAIVGRIRSAKHREGGETKAATKREFTLRQLERMHDW